MSATASIYMNGAPGQVTWRWETCLTARITSRRAERRTSPLSSRQRATVKSSSMATAARHLFNLMAANYNYFEGITFRNANVAFLLGIKNIAGASGFTLKHSRIYDVGRAVQADWSGSKNFYIADNVFIGRHDPNKMMGWTRRSVWSSFPAIPNCCCPNMRSKFTARATSSPITTSRTGTTASISPPTATPDGAPNDIPDRVPDGYRFLQQRYLQHGRQLL